MPRLFLSLLLLALGLAACGAPSPRSMYEAVERDVAGANEFDLTRLSRLDERIEQLATDYRAGKIESADDLFYAAGVLWRAQDVETLELATVVGQRAAKAGRPDALRFVAYATDLRCMKTGKLQRYGTQMVFQPVTRKWKLYAYDRITTDAERAEMGVPPLATMLARVDRRNDVGDTVPIGRE